MPIKRRAGKELNFSITAEHVALYRWAKSIEESGDSEVWESDGGRQREFLNVTSALEQLVGLQLWDSSLFSENVQNDAVSGPVRAALEAAAMVEERQGWSLVRPNGNGLSGERAGI
jgi:hypothetical protein